jgi:hypothetical protein
LLGGIAEQRRIFAPEFRLFVFIGILGGFTTFSAFADETASLVHNGPGAAGVTVHRAAGHCWAIRGLAGRSPGAVCLTFDGLATAQEFLKILEPWLTLGRLTNSGEVFYGEKTSEGFDI